MANYIAIVHKDLKSDFGVSFPDFPGCITAGSNIDEAKDMAQDGSSNRSPGCWWYLEVVSKHSALANTSSSLAGSLCSSTRVGRSLGISRTQFASKRVALGICTQPPFVFSLQSLGSVPHASTTHSSNR